jgi:hypothetical protein
VDALGLHRAKAGEQICRGDAGVVGGIYICSAVLVISGSAMGNLAETLRVQGQLSAAQALLEQALTIRQRVFESGASLR